MGRYKSKAVGKQYTHKISRTGGGASYTVTLPIAVMRKFKWRERQKVNLVINEKKKTITIKDWKK